MSQASLLPHASASVARERTVVDYERHGDDWYVEPPWVVDQLLRATPFAGVIHDPCCGSGNIPRRLDELGYNTTASDIVDRGYGDIRDFFLDLRPRQNIVCNPPYKMAEMFILHAIDVTERRVAAIVNLKFLASQGRRDRLFLRHPPDQVLICSQRPSMPPGGSGIEAKGGTADYCWIVWRKGGGDTRVSWLF